MTNLACPLCDHSDGVLIRELPFAGIWQELALQHGVRFSPELIHQHTPAETTVLLSCPVCELEYFTPAIAGSGEFYRQLTSADSTYYNPETWDFRCAIKCTPVGSSLLDVACGSGAFLALAQRNGLRAQGIDTNQDAINQARAAGLSAELMALEPFSKLHAGSFDVVTVFQVLEHLDRVVPFTRQAASCVRTGGRLLISVPNRHRLWRQRLEPLDCPPHHLSRWAGPQFNQLALHCGLELKQIHFEPVTFLDLFVPLYRRPKRPALISVSGEIQLQTTAPLLNRSWVRQGIAPLRRQSKFLTKLGLHRHGMLAEFAVPTHW